MKQGLVKRVLVICPLSIMYSAWQADIFNTAMHRTSGVAHGTANKRTDTISLFSIWSVMCGAKCSGIANLTAVSWIISMTFSLTEI